MKMTWDGLLVGPDQWSPKHPQLLPKPSPVDPESLQISRPDQAAGGNDNNFFSVYTNTGLGKLGTTLQTFGLSVNVGAVEVTTS